MRIFVVTGTDSVFVGAYDSREKAQSVVDRMEGTMIGSNNEIVELGVYEETLNDLSMFVPRS